ncbi:uncharacterized protein A4U43_C05F24750 [Asparagus officinalis]|uniref:RING-type E3 ubiquitin transferase n=1 Tax=Asparagus officinalis TaxID=4686 RepID=A0A5P1EWS2_ASPOF|nr:RING-H2 finger protein ATL43-like [Asparagus officinalis]ONK69607.1 uncharacterized protein A4U43_C05F24750 [Asparagus officinalis]
MSSPFSSLPRLLLAEGHAPSPFPSPPTASFRPSIAVIIGVLTTMFSLTFLLLLYAKHCKRDVDTTYGRGNAAQSFTAEHRNSGVNRSIVNSLPVFRFGSLTGHKEGLECAVCLNRFEPAEVLRLLPKCKHGFHVECIDTWLEAHATCPLCRVRVQPEDVLLVFDPKPDPDPAAESKKG